MMNLTFKDAWNESCYLHEQFKWHFKVSKETFECILRHLVQTLQRRQGTCGRLQTTLEKIPYDAAMVLGYIHKENARSIS